MSSDFTFPSPVGGVPFPEDFAPSILFAALYGLTFFVAVYRLFRKRSRTFVLMGIMSYVGERVAIFSLRAAQARSATDRVKPSLAEYMQMSFAVGFLSISGDLLTLLRCVLVNATLSKSTVYNGALIDPEPASSFQLKERVTHSPPPSVSEPDAKSEPKPECETPGPESTERAKERHSYRSIYGILSLLYWIPFGFGIASGALTNKAETSASAARIVWYLRYTSTGLAFCLIFVIQWISIYSISSIRNVDRRASLLLAGLSTLLNVTAVYRLVVMRFKTTALDSTAPGSLNGIGSHACFYVFHVAPEFLVAATVLCINAREIFGTGLGGDKPPSKRKTKKTKEAKEMKEARQPKESKEAKKSEVTEGPNP